MKIVHKVNLKISQDTGGKRVLFNTYDDTSLEQTISGLDHENDGDMSIAAAVAGPDVWVEVPLGNVSAVKGFCLIADHDFNVRLNDSSDVLEFKKQGDYCFAFNECVISKIEILNPSDEDIINMIYSVWGDPSA